MEHVEGAEVGELAVLHSSLHMVAVPPHVEPYVVHLQNLGGEGRGATVRLFTPPETGWKRAGQQRTDGSQAVD